MTRLAWLYYIHSCVHTGDVRLHSGAELLRSDYGFAYVAPSPQSIALPTHVRSGRRLAELGSVRTGIALSWMASGWVFVSSVIGLLLEKWSSLATFRTSLNGHLPLCLTLSLNVSRRQAGTAQVAWIFLLTVPGLFEVTLRTSVRHQGREGSVHCTGLFIVGDVWNYILSIRQALQSLCHHHGKWSFIADVNLADTNTGQASLLMNGGNETEMVDDVDLIACLENFREVIGLDTVDTEELLLTYSSWANKK